MKQAVKKVERCGCCSLGQSKNTEDQIRDLINLVKVYSKEEIQDVTTRIDSDTADELIIRLRLLAKNVGKVCK